MYFEVQYFNKKPCFLLEQGVKWQSNVKGTIMTTERSSRNKSHQHKLHQPTPIRPGAVGVRFFEEKNTYLSTAFLAWHRDVTHNVEEAIRYAAIIYADGHESPIPFAANSALLGCLLQACQELTRNVATLAQNLEGSEPMQNTSFWTSPQPKKTSASPEAKSFALS